MPVLFDSSVYIRALRTGGDARLLQRRWAAESPIWLSAVVLEELYAGAAPKARRVLATLERDFERASRILVPNLRDWANAGKVLARVAERYGHERIGRARLTNDALVATSAARAGIKLITSNRRDFALLSEFCPLQWEEQPQP